METYETLRHFADSWGLVGLFLIFLAAVLWAFRPSASRLHEDAASIPFRDEHIARTIPDLSDTQAAKTEAKEDFS